MNRISFCMIVKNAAGDLGEFLPDLAPLFHEVIIVDTGSTDGTPEVAALMGARVICHTWHDSFAEARNVYVQAARGEWIFSIDADERIAHRDLPRVRMAATGPRRALLMTTRNYVRDQSLEGFTPCRGEYARMEKDYPGWTPSTKVRMFPRLPGVIYEGQVRELLEPSLIRHGVAVDELPVPIHHFGRETVEKRIYYRQLLAAKAADHPDDPRVLLELASADFHLQHFDDAATELEEALNLHESGHQALYFDASGACNLQGVALIRLGDEQRALQAFDRGLRLGGASVQTIKNNRDELFRRHARPTLGVIMIVRNEEQNLPAILADIRDVADEIVVVDTGSTDRTVELAREGGARVGHFAWCDDFAAARNAAIDLATADYLLWLDADDRLNPEEAAQLNRLKKELPAEHDTAWLLKILNETGEEGTPPTMSYQARLFPRIPGARFAGRVHEQILPALKQQGVKAEQTDIAIRHTGYHSADEIRAKARRNLEILKAELRAGKDTPSQHFVIASSCFAAGEYDEALHHLQTARTRGLQPTWFKYSFSLAADCHLKRGRTDEAARELSEAAREFSSSGLMHYFLGAVLVGAGQHAEALPVLEKARTLEMEVETFPVPPDIPERLPYYLGQARERTGDLVGALTAYRESLSIRPDWLPPLQALGLLLVRQGKAGEAREILQQVHKLSDTPDTAVIVALAGIALYEKRPDDATDLYREMLAVRPADRSALTGLIQTGILSDDVEQLVEALSMLMESCGLDTDRGIDTLPDLAGLLSEVAGIIFKQGDELTAERLLTAALQLDPDCAPAHLARGDLFLERKQRQEALDCYRQALLAGAPPDEVEERMQRLEGDL